MNGLLFFIGLVVILFVGRAIFLPLLLAAFFWYLINAIASYYRKALPYSKSIIAGVSAAVLAAATMIGLMYMFATRVRPMFAQFQMKLPDIQIKLHEFVSYASARLGVNLDYSMLPSIVDITHVGGFAISLAATLGLVLVYVFFMFIEQSTFAKKLSAMFQSGREAKKLSFILESIDANIKKYLFMKTFISAMTGILSYAWLYYLGLEFAGVWAVIIFVMNYIPTFGSIIACALPILYAMITADSMHTPALVAAGLVALQIVLGNLLEPKLTGKTLNLSTLAILINLVFWGMLWGPVGAFFSVPLLVATFIATAQFDRTRWIAVLLSANGEIPEKND
jgi:predicted PurR-regulated permease PerM